MISEFIQKTCFQGATVIAMDGNAIAARILSNKKAPLSGGVAYKLAVLYYLKTRELDFEKAADAVISSIEGVTSVTERGKPMTIEANWIVTGNGAGIYLFDAINTKGNAGYRGMLNVICTIDQETGKAFFKSGTIKNEVVSKRLELLYSEYEPGKEAELARELVPLFEVLMMALDDGKLLRRAKPLGKKTAS